MGDPSGSNDESKSEELPLISEELPLISEELPLISEELPLISEELPQGNSPSQTEQSVAGDCSKESPESELKKAVDYCLNQCRFCLKLFKNSSSARTHQYVCHKNPNKKLFNCPKCGRAFSRKRFYEAHIASEKCFLRAVKNCSYPGCDFAYFFKTVLIKHLRTCHESDVKPEENYVFNDWNEFCKWKDDEEAKTFSYYSQQSGEKGKTVHFYCQQDGSGKRHSKSDSSLLNSTDIETKEILDIEELNDDVQQSSTSIQSVQPSIGVYEETVLSTEKKAPAKRKPNLKGRIKMGNVCISMIKAKKQEDGSVKVRYYPTHSHPLDVNDLKHQPLKASSEEFMKHHLSLGICQRRIRNIVREEKFSRVNRSFVQSSKFTRNDFINLKSIREQKIAQLKVVDSLKADDASAAHLIMEKLRNEPYDPVLIYKPAGSDPVAGPDSARHLPKSTFIIGIQTRDQLDLMLTLSTDILIVDAVRDVTHFGCHLLNIVGVDELNRGYPLGHCLTNKMDEETLKHFFKAILERVPDIKVNCIITDDYPELINAARKGLDDSGIKHLLCLWQFKKTLQKQLRTKVRNSSLETEVFKILSTAVDVESEKEFYQLLSAFHQKYDNTKLLSNFLKYIANFCMPKVKKWAMCYRKFPHRCVETTMFAESFNNFLKSLYLKYNLSKRIDTLLNLLLLVEEDYYFRRRRLSNIIVTPHGKKSFMKNLSLLHEKSLAIPDSIVVEVIEDSLWEVMSESNDDVVYEVLRCSYECTHPDMCFFQCNSSLCQNLCTHLYVCSCPDEDSLCNHVHKVHSIILKETDNVLKSSLSSNDLYHPEITFYQISEDSQEDNHAESDIKEIISTNSTEPCYERELLQMASELTDHIKNPAVKQSLHPHILGVFRQLIAECEAVEKIYYEGNSNTQIEIETTENTQNRTSGEKITCQVVPFKKLRKFKRTNIPTTREKQEICSKLLESAALKESNSYREGYNCNSLDMLTKGQIVTIQIPSNSDHTYTDFDIDIQLNQEVVTQPMEYS